MCKSEYKLIRKMQWDGDVLKVQDIMHDVLREAKQSMTDAMTGEVLNHFECDMSDFREYMHDKIKWERKQELAMPRWIPVTERLPEVEEGYTDCESFEEDKDGEFYPVGVYTSWESEPVLVFGNFDGHRGRYLARYTEWRYTDGRPKECEWVAVDIDVGLSFVTHWMPIPEPPKEADDGSDMAL